MMKQNRIIIPLDDGMKLIAETGTDDEYPRELYIGIEDKNGVWNELVYVGQDYEYLNDQTSYIKGKYKIYVSENMIDYTQAFRIEQKEEE